MAASPLEAPATDVAVAAAAAAAAAARLRAVRRRGLPPAQLRSAGDLEAQQVIEALLADQRPRDAVLSEEAPDDPVRLDAERVWIVDPLDGTREFGEPGRTDWAVHVALWQTGELVAAAVALPASGALYTTTAPPRPGAAARPARVVVSRSRPPEAASAVAAALGGTLRPLGSAGAKVMAVATGQAEAYVHAGGQFEWDSAAPVAVARAAGLHCSRLDGSALRYNRPDPWLPDLLVCRPELTATILDALDARTSRQLPGS